MSQIIGSIRLYATSRRGSLLYIDPAVIDAIVAGLEDKNALGGQALPPPMQLHPFLQELADAREGAAAFGDEPRVEMPHVRHLLPDFDLGLAAGRPHPVRHAHGVVAQDFIAPHLD